MISGDEGFAEWAIVEMMGHRRLAGYVCEQEIAGQGFLRLDIPDVEGDRGRTQYLAPGSIYAIHPVTEETARKTAEAWRPEPVQRWELPAIEPKPAPTVLAEDYDDSDGGDWE